MELRRVITTWSLSVQAEQQLVALSHGGSDGSMDDDEPERQRDSGKDGGDGWIHGGCVVTREPAGNSDSEQQRQQHRGRLGTEEPSAEVTGWMAGRRRICELVWQRLGWTASRLLEEDNGE